MPACPSCSSEVAFDDVVEADACPACATPLDDLFRLARDRRRAGWRSR